MKLNDRTILRNAIFGLYATLPGMERMLDACTRVINDTRAEIHRLEAQLAAMEGRKAKGRPPTVKRKPTHPHDVNHPGHAKWLANIRRSRKRAWKKMTPEQRATQLAKMARGRKGLRAVA